ncbi:MAG: ATP-binding protein [Planctomycetes bacterium]|nr:ATP-binding protein [Planctomycetota bacterium]
MKDEQIHLRESFASFVAAARELEQSYAALRTQAAAVDLQLQESNRALQQSLAEREAMFAALPIGLVSLRVDGAVGTQNVEAERLIARASRAGVDLLGCAAGEVAFDGAAVRVQRVALADGELLLLEDRSQLQQLEREVHRLDRLAGLSELALGVAHEIKNPLNGLLGFASLLQRSEDPKAMKRYAGKIGDGVRAVDDIVKGLLGFARPAQKTAHMATLRQVAERVAAAADLPRVRLRLEPAADGAFDAQVDADAVGRVLANLVRNALEAAPATAVHMQARRLPGCVELIVADDGPGVPAHIAPTAFEPFVSSKERGTGLGLALSARVLSFLGGELELLNPGQPGARFRVRVPVIAEAAARQPLEAHA